MRNGHDRPRVGLQVMFEPGNRFRVEMVGRLVEEQEVGGTQQEPAEGNATPLASRERGDVRIARRTPQRVHRHLDLRIEFPGTDLIDSILHASLLGQDLVHFVGVQVFAKARVERVELIQQRADLSGAFFDVAFDVLRGIESRFLGQVAHRDAGSRKRFAEERRVVARHDFQQRALAGAVQAEDANLRAGQEREPDVFQDLMVGWMDLPEPFHRVDELWCHEYLRGVTAVERMMSAQNCFTRGPTSIPCRFVVSSAGLRASLPLRLAARQP